MCLADRADRSRRRQLISTRALRIDDRGRDEERRLYARRVVGGPVRRCQDARVDARGRRDEAKWRRSECD